MTKHVNYKPFHRHWCYMHVTTIHPVHNSSAEGALTLHKSSPDSLFKPGRKLASRCATLVNKAFAMLILWASAIGAHTHSLSGCLGYVSDASSLRQYATSSWILRLVFFFPSPNPVIICSGVRSSPASAEPKPFCKLLQGENGSRSERMGSSSHLNAEREGA